MKTQEMVDSINAVVAALSGPSAETIDAYTHYAQWAGAAGVFIGVALIAVALFFGTNYKITEKMEGFNWFPACICFVIGIIVILCNVGNAISPEGAAIHQFIRDIRGN